MATFGKAGIINFQTSIDQVQVNIQNGERLDYSIKVTGAKPLFNLTRAGITLWSEADFPNVQGNFARSWPANAAELGPRGVNNTLSMSFFGASHYDVEITLVNSQGQRTKIREFTCSSADQSDHFSDFFNVFYI